MARIRLDHVVYDGQFRGFRATASIFTRDGRKDTPCFWPGGVSADFAAITRGLANDAMARVG